MDTIGSLFEEAGCIGAAHIVDLASGADVAFRADEPVVMASVFKAIVALEFYAQAAAAKIDPAQPFEIAPGAATPGPDGHFQFP